MKGEKNIYIFITYIFPQFFNMLAKLKNHGAGDNKKKAKLKQKYLVLSVFLLTSLHFLQSFSVH